MNGDYLTAGGGENLEMFGIVDGDGGEKRIDHVMCCKECDLT